MIRLRIALFVFAVMALAKADTMVVPGNLANANGGSSQTVSFLFNTTASTENLTARFQQVYDDSLFGAIPIEITGLRFRPSTSGGPFDFTFPQIDISLSTTSAEPGAMSFVFGDNLGADETLVFTEPLNIASAQTGTHNGPMGFDIVIDFASPFHYDPSAGNLLLEVRNHGNVDTLANFVFYYMDSFTGPLMS